MTAAHSGDAVTLDWHPIKPNIIATGGSNDRLVKVWDLELYLSVLSNNTNNNKDDNNMYKNSNTYSSRGDSVISDSSGNDSYK